MSQVKDSHAERILSYSALCSIWFLAGLDEAHPGLGGQSVSLTYGFRFRY